MGMETSVGLDNLLIVCHLSELEMGSGAMKKFRVEPKWLNSRPDIPSLETKVITFVLCLNK